MNKKKNILILLLSLVTILILSLNIINYIKLDNIYNERNESFSLRTIESLNCNNKPMLYYEGKNYNIYTYCLDYILLVEDSTFNLKEYLYEDPKILDKIFKKLASTYSFGKSVIYHDYKIPNISNHGISIIKCNGENSLNDIYIGPSDMYFKKNFCKKDNHTFVRTYLVKNIEKYSTSEDEGITNSKFLVTLEQFQYNTETVIIDGTYDLVIGNNYEFEFMKENNYIDDNIKSIFENSSIVEIRKTDKEGHEQIQEEIK